MYYLLRDGARLRRFVVEQFTRLRANGFIDQVAQRAKPAVRHMIS